MSLFIRLTLAVAAVLVGFIVLLFLVKVLLIAAVVAGVGVGIALIAGVFRRRHLERRPPMMIDAPR